MGSEKGVGVCENQQSGELEGLAVTLRAGPGVRGQGSGCEAAHLGSGEEC